MLGRAGKITALISVLIFCLAVNPPLVVAQAKKIRVGILQFSRELRYEQAKAAILEELGRQGFSEPGVEFSLELANGNKATAMKLAQKLAAQKFDLYLTFGTTGTEMLANAVKDTPIVFCVVYDPVLAKIALDWNSSGNNTTGTSTMVPVPKILQTLQNALPIKKMAVLYTPGEVNSELQVRHLQAEQEKFKLEIIPVAVLKKSEISVVLHYVIGKVDAIYLTGSSVVGESVSEIADTAAKAKVITVTHLMDLVPKGCLIGISANLLELGSLAGKKAALVLKGAKPAEIPIETAQNFEIVLNMKTLKNGQFKLSEDFLKSVSTRIK